jgi:hypothetical protein
MQFPLPYPIPQGIVPFPVQRISKPRNRHPFSAAEDSLLRSLTERLGKDWVTISLYFQSRTARQCRDRYNFYLAPTVVRGDWTTADETLLMAKLAELGPRWSEIAHFFPGRPACSIRNEAIFLVRREETREKRTRNSHRSGDDPNIPDPDEPKNE